MPRGSWIRDLLVRRSLVSAFTAAVATLPCPAHAEKASTDLFQLTVAADAICEARVTSVQRSSGILVAEATVTHSMKGPVTGRHLAFLASPTWLCDTTTAVKGEMVLLFLFLPGLEATAQDLLSSHKAHTVEAVTEREDLFYCLHNAARSAQLGRDTVPPNFDPMADGGAIHERRHALTWCLSPAVAWDDTDLSS